LDLDFVLSEYTEDEKDDSGSELDDYECIDSCDRKKTVNTDKPKIVVSFGYLCPVCNKTFKTVAGFLGHCSKQQSRNVT